MATITANISAEDSILPVSEQAPSPGAYYTIDDEAVRLLGSQLSPTQGEDRTRWLVERAVAGTTAATHTSGATLTRYYPDAASVGGGEGAGVLEDPGVAWQASHAYSVGDRFAETVEGELRVFEITVAGTSGAGVFSDHGPFDLAPLGEWGTNSETFIYIGIVGQLPWTVVPALAGGLVIGDVEGNGRPLVYTTGGGPGDSERMFALEATVAGTAVSILNAKTDGDADWMLDENASAGFRFSVAVDGESVIPAKDVQMTTDHFRVSHAGVGLFQVDYDTWGIRITGLPTADPAVAGRLWIDTAAGRVLKVSAG